MRFVDIDKVKKNLDENKPDWTAEDYAVACEDAEFYSSMEDFIAEHDDEIEMMMFAPELVPDEPTWIPCSERLPEKSGEYLVYTEYEDVFKCYFEKENDPKEDECQWGFYQDYRDPDTLGWEGTTWTAVETVTHWQNLPEPPKEDET